MTNPETVSEAFIKWMEGNNLGTFATDIFLNRISDGEPNNAYWIITSGGDVTQLNVTRESVQQFSVQVNYRNKSGEEVEHNLFALNQLVNSRGDFALDGFDLFSIEASMPEDNDRDAEGRRQGLLTVAIQIYVS